MNNGLYAEYFSCLEKWISSSEKYLYPIPGRPDLECFGSGYNDWGVQTNQKAFAAYAVVAGNPDFNSSIVGMKRDKLIDHAVKMLRFSLQSHIEGDYKCLDGTKWGHTWISALGIERMMHGIEAMEDYLKDQDRDMIKKVLLSECNWLVDHYEVVAGTIENNKPESNLWNGSLLLRVAYTYPDNPRNDEYKNKFVQFIINSISVASDAASIEIVNGKPVTEWYEGDNFFETYALNHHGYLNIGYMVICLSNVAILHFMFRKKGIEAPKELYNHVKDLWEIVKLFIFPDGRLLRIGGDTRVRYCYCQDYLIPVFLMMQDYFGQEFCKGMETDWLQKVVYETKKNGDGSFLSARCCELENMDPQYYTRLETDRAVTLSMGAYWRRTLNINPGEKEIQFQTNITGTWYDGYHGACLCRGEKRIVSWVWKSAERPQGLCLPPWNSNMAEWKENLSGEIKGLGMYNYQQIISHREYLFKGGFLTSGITITYSDQHFEGRSVSNSKEKIAYKKIVFAALPDDRTTIVMQYAIAPKRCYLKSVKGLLLRIPNDIYNNNRRIYHTVNGTHEIIGVGSREELMDMESSWINIDGQISIIGVYGGDNLKLLRPGRRQIGVKSFHRDVGLKDFYPSDIGFLYADEICYPCKLGTQCVDENSVLFDIGLIIQIGTDKKDTSHYAEYNKYSYFKMDNGLRAILVTGADAKRYLLIANLSANYTKESLRISKAGNSISSAKKEYESGSSDEDILLIEISGNSAILYVNDENWNVLT